MLTFTNPDNRFSCCHKLERSFTSVKANLTLFLTRSLFLCFWVLLWSGVAFGQNPTPIGKPGKASDFEIDGDFISNNYTSPGVDWRSLFTVDAANPPFVTKTPVAGENATWIVDGNSGSGSTIPEREVFKGSSNKNGDFIGAGQSPYLIETASPSAPQKNDITNVYARATVVSGSQWIMLGAETRSVDGTSYLDFEYNKVGVQISGANLVGNGPLAQGGRTARNGNIAGDVLFVVDFAKGGNAPTPRIFEWRATGKTKPTHDWIELDLSQFPNSVFIVTNGSNIQSLGFNSGFAGNGASSNTVIALQLVEMGVNLTALGLADNVCSPNATLTCKTRTSSSYTSELKDFSLFNFSAVPSATLTDPADQPVCAGADATFSTTAAGPGASVNNISWYKVVGTTETLLSDDADYDITISGQTSTLKVLAVTASDAGTYRAKLSGATCGTPSQDATLTVKANAALTNLTNLTKCPGSSETAVFSTTVSGDGASADNVEWYFGTTKLSNGTKYTISTSGSTSTLTINGIVEADEGTYTAKLTNADCGAPEKSGTLTVNPLPDANAGADPAAQCFIAAGNVFDLDGSSSVNGTAKWTRVSPANLPQGVTVNFDNDESLTPKVTVSGATNGITVTLRLTVTSNSTPACGSDFDDVTVEVKAQAQSKDGDILPITCTDVSFKLKIVPDANTTYSITQPCNSAYNNSEPVVDNDGNFIFEGLKFGAGYKIVATKDGCEAAPTICGGETCSDICATDAAITKVQSDESAKSQIVSGNQKVETVNAKIEAAKSRVLAAPNPFYDKIKFTLESEVSGQGSLEIYNMLGQKVKTVFQGYVQKGQVQNVEYNVPSTQRTNLIYIFRVGEKQVTGKLMGLQ